MIITIDGPVASGKSTIAMIIAQKLHCYYIASGLLYRALAYAALHEHIDIIYITEQQVQQLLERLTYLYIDNEAKIIFEQEDVTEKLYTPVLDEAASSISVHLYVRAAVNRWQHQLAEHENVVVDGRDAGSKLFPQADVKFYFDTPLVLRAERWLKKQLHYGKQYNMAEAVTIVEQRDYRDTHRKHDPLVIPSDAVVLKNDSTKEIVVQQVLDVIAHKMKS